MSSSKKRKKPLSFVEKMKKMTRAALAESVSPNSTRGYEWNELTSLEERIKKIIRIADNNKKNEGKMLFFVMYDIESNKVRNQVVKYLLQKGCIRVQKSIFLANLEADTYQQIRNDLIEVQAVYDNHDSILIVPISTDYLYAMKIIGQSIDIDLILQNKNTLFF